MELQPKYYLVERSLLPEVFLRVVDANTALKSGACRTASEAAASVGLSRSAFYKYKDGVRPFFEMTTDCVVTFHLMVGDKPGVLSGILDQFARAGANLLTVNQGIPISGQASITIAARTGQMGCTIDTLTDSIRALDGVQSMDILARE